MLFEERAQASVLSWQFECLAEMGSVFVAIETRLVGRDFKQDTTRRAKIDRPEVIAIDHRSDRIACVDKCLANLQLRGPVLSGKAI